MVDETTGVVTVVDRPAKRSRTSDDPPPAPLSTDSRLPSSRESDAASFVLALRRAEIERTRKFAPIVIVMAGVGLVLLTLIGGDPLALKLAYTGILSAVAAVLYLHSLTRNPDNFTEGRVGIAYGVCIVSVFAIVFYWGIFSPAVGVVSFGIFFVGIGRSTRIGAALYGFSVVCQGTLAVAIIGGAIDDRGLITAAGKETREQILQQVMVQVIYLVTYLIARTTRSQLDRAVSDHDQAVRAVAQRDALLVEARAELDEALKIGGPGRYSDQIVGSYRLGVLLGRGAMGDVYDAVHVETGEPAAVKLLSAAGLATPGQLARLYREAQAAARIESPHIVALREVCEPGTGVPYLAMDKLDGSDLAEILRDRRRLPLDEACRLANQIASGLEAARREGIVHRDIKPQNLFLVGADPPVWKILDFGVSKLADDHGTLTRGHVVGTPMYMAPEQARGEPVDHRTDVFALATVLYRACTGQPPYGGRDLPSVLYNVVYKVPQRPSELVELPRDLDRVLAIGFAKHPDDRFASALELADALTAAAESKLAPALRERADRVISGHPWGSSGTSDRI